MQLKRYNLADGFGYTFDENNAWEAEDGVFCLASDVERTIDALIGMVQQFAFRTDKGALWTGGLSALEEAFEVLDWEDPHEEGSPA